MSTCFLRRMYELSMLEYDRSDVSEGIYVKKPLVRTNVLFVITGTFLGKIFDFSQKYVMIVMI